MLWLHICRRPSVSADYSISIALTGCCWLILLESADTGGHGSGRSSGWDKANNTALQCMYIQLLLILTSFLLTFDTFLFRLVWLLKQLGANGYIFAIDANGYLLLHPNLQPKVMRVIATMYKDLFSLLYLFNPPALMLSSSLWTFLSPWHWIFWMQRWRTAVKRRWAWNAPGLRCSRFQALCALVTELSLDVTTGPVGSRSSRGTFCPNPCDFFFPKSSNWKKKKCFMYFRSGDKWLMDDRVKCRSKLSSSPSMRQVFEVISSEWNIEEHFCRSRTLLMEVKSSYISIELCISSSCIVLSLCNAAIL